MWNNSDDEFYAGFASALSTLEEYEKANNLELQFPELYKTLHATLVVAGEE